MVIWPVFVVGTPSMSLTGRLQAVEKPLECVPLPQCSGPFNPRPASRLLARDEPSSLDASNPVTDEQAPRIRLKGRHQRLDPVAGQTQRVGRGGDDFGRRVNLDVRHGLPLEILRTPHFQQARDARHHARAQAHGHSRSHGAADVVVGGPPAWRLRSAAAVTTRAICPSSTNVLMMQLAPDAPATPVPPSPFNSPTTNAVTVAPSLA